MSGLSVGAGVMLHRLPAVGQRIAFLASEARFVNVRGSADQGVTARHSIALMQITHCTAIVWGVLPSVDRGAHVPLDETLAHIHDGSLPRWLPAQLDDSGRIELSIVSAEAWAELMPFFAEQQGPREFGIGGERSDLPRGARHRRRSATQGSLGPRVGNP